MKKSIIVLGCLTISLITTLFLISCSSDTTSHPVAPEGSAAELAGYAQMGNGSTVVGDQQLNWAVSQWGSFPYGNWVYIEVNQQNAVGQPPGRHQVPVTLGNVVLRFSNLPDEVTRILIGVKAIHDVQDHTFTTSGVFTVTDGSVSIPLEYGDLVSFFGVTHYSIWFQAIGGKNGRGGACGRVALLGTMFEGREIALNRPLCFGTTPTAAPTPAPTPTPQKK